MAQDAHACKEVAADEMRRSKAQRRWKDAALKETQRLRVEQLRSQQLQEARDAERKQTASRQLEQEIAATLGSRSWPAVLSHFGVASYKQALIKFHPDRAPPGADFEDIVRREVVFKYVQMRHDRVSVECGDQPDEQRRRQQREQNSQARREQQEAAARAEERKNQAAEEAERRRNAVPEGAVLRVTGATWSGFGQPPAAGPLGFYAVESHCGPHGRPMYRKLPPVERADWAPWSAKAAKDALEAADQIWWTRGIWQLGHRREQRVTYMAACADPRPPANEWEVVDSRESEPHFTWL